MEMNARDKMRKAIGAWIEASLHEPSWKKFRRDRIHFVLNFDDPYALDGIGRGNNLTLPAELEFQRDILEKYLSLEQSLSCLKSCEYYFRRYPFAGLPVSKHDHLSNICEMFFSRFYEFRERLKIYGNLIAEYNKEIKYIGSLIREFDKYFDDELRARHGVHHRERFSDVAIERIMLMEMAFDKRPNDWSYYDARSSYRKFVNEWVLRVRRRGARLEEFLEAIAKISIYELHFLRDYTSNLSPPSTAPA